jgi:uncharacterized repeat protein (TIGR01451 family)
VRSACQAVVLAAVLVWPYRAAIAAPDLEVRKSVDTPTPSVGEPVEFTVTVRNIGPDPALDVLVDDRLPGELSIPVGLAPFPSIGSYDAATGEWTVGDLDAGSSAILVIPAVISAASPPGCIVNVAETADGNDSNPLNNRAVAAVRRTGTERCVDVAASFFNVVVGPATCGLDGHFDIVVELTNAGPDAARSVVVDLGQDPVIAPNLRFTDMTCTGARCTIAVLDAGASVRLAATSDDFRNTQPRDVSLRLAVSSTDDDYSLANNVEKRDLTIPPFDDCGGGLDGGTGGFVFAGCFIATAAYGSALDPHVVTLRRFRDRYLERSELGRAFVRFYYRYSPPLARIIADHAALRVVARALLTPLVLTIAYPFRAGLVLLLAISIVTVRRFRRMKRRTLTAGLDRAH